jgi:hypothetical protein
LFNICHCNVGLTFKSKKIYHYFTKSYLFHKRKFPKFASKMQASFVNEAPEYFIKVTHWPCLSDLHLTFILISLTEPNTLLTCLHSLSNWKLFWESTKSNMSQNSNIQWAAKTSLHGKKKNRLASSFIFYLWIIVYFFVKHFTFKNYMSRLNIVIMTVDLNLHTVYTKFLLL